jgi:hypothetical protein
VQATTTRLRLVVTADGTGVVSHCGSRLLADAANRTTLTGELSLALAELRKPRARHDPGRVLVDMAVAVADGATTISDIAVLADQGQLFGAVASDSTCWRLLNQLDTTQLGVIGAARAAAREMVCAQRAEVTDEPFPLARAAGRELPGLVLDLDASVVICHSEKDRRRRRSSTPSATTRCSRFATTPGSFWPQPCAGATLMRTPPPITSPCSMRAWPRFPTLTGTARRSWSKPNAT